MCNVFKDSTEMYDLSKNFDPIDVSLFHRIAEHLIGSRTRWHLTEGTYTVPDGIDNWIVQVSKDENGLSVKIRKELELKKYIHIVNFYRVVCNFYDFEGNISHTDVLYSLSFTKLADFELKMRLKAKRLERTFSSTTERIKLTEGSVMKCQTIFVGDSEECFISDIKVEDSQFVTMNDRTRELFFVSYNKVSHRWKAEELIDDTNLRFQP